EEAISGRPFILDSEGNLRKSDEVAAYPRELFDIWPSEQLANHFDAGRRPALSLHVRTSDCGKLVERGAIAEVSTADVLSVLQAKHLPKPKTWNHLLNLWAWLDPEVTSWQMLSSRSKLRIVPAQGKNVLYSASEVVRLGEKRLLQSDSDWEFLSAHL